MASPTHAVRKMEDLPPPPRMPFIGFVHEIQQRPEREVMELVPELASILGAYDAVLGTKLVEHFLRWYTMRNIGANVERCASSVAMTRTFDAAEEQMQALREKFKPKPASLSAQNLAYQLEDSETALAGLLKKMEDLTLQIAEAKKLKDELLAQIATTLRSAEIAKAQADSDLEEAKKAFDAKQTTATEASSTLIRLQILLQEKTPK